MSEKLSEMSIRQEKVNQLKTKLLGEVSEELNHYFEILHEHKCDSGDEQGKNIITQMHNLYELQAFLNWEEAFMYTHAVYPDLDKIVYELSSNTLDWMLQEEFLLSHILSSIELSNAPVESVLSDTFFNSPFSGCSIKSLGIRRKKKWRRKMEKRNKLCPCRKTCRNECYGENPCCFAKTFDGLHKKIDKLKSENATLKSEKVNLTERLNAVLNPDF